MNTYIMIAEFAFLAAAGISVLITAFCSTESNRDRHPVLAMLLCLVYAVLCNGMQQVYSREALYIYLSLAFMALSLLCILLMIFNIGGKAGYKNLLASLLAFVAAVLLWGLH